MSDRPLSVRWRRHAGAAAGIVLMAAGPVILGLPGAAQAKPVVPLLLQARDDTSTWVQDTASAVTKNGDGEFATTAITVSQTEGLVNQVIRIHWTGGAPTKPDFGNLGVNYLQIMQCWSASPDEAPTREQCEFGAQRAWNGGANTNSRQMTTGIAVDPNETMYDAYKDGDLSYVPFHSWTDDTTTGNKSSYFDRYTTNEVDHARTRPDGTGEEFFEVVTGVEAPGLGCGQTSSDGFSPQCWIVVVPRGSTEVDGTQRGTTTGDPLDTTPLLTSNWRNRIAFPIQFQPIGQACPMGRTEIPLLGTDRISEAITRWQPSLCDSSDGNYSFTVLGDFEARNKLMSDKPDMVFVTYGVQPDLVPKTHPVVYAPVALSGLTIAFDLESQSSTIAADEVRRKDGQRMQGIKLNQRLVAKALTQSYRFDAAPDASRVEKNAWDMSHDPEFLQLNPQFGELAIPALGKMMVTIGQSDSAQLLWDWIMSDPDAKAFMAGKADPWGMKINPKYKGATYPRSDFPRSDNVCVTYPNRSVPMCTFDLFPYAADLYQSARAASRGDTMSTGVYDPVAIPPGNKKTPPQEPGRRAMIVLTDSALSQRFALNPALLKNANGEYVAPTEESIAIAGGAAKATGVPGIVQPDPGAKVKGAYPLASFTYAATSPPAITKAAGADYARMLAYAAADGQHPGDNPGELPLGYTPLPAKARAQSLAASKAIAKAAGVAIDAGSTDDTGSTGGGGGGGGGTGGGGTGGGGTGGGGTGGGSGGGGSNSGTSTTTTTDPTYTDTSGGAVVPPVTPPVDTPAAPPADPVTAPSAATTADPAAVGGSGSDPTSGNQAGADNQAAGTDTVAAPDSVAVAALVTPSSPVGLTRYFVAFLVIAGGAALALGSLLGRSLTRKDTTP